MADDDWRSRLAIHDEQRFEAEHDIRYVVRPATTASDHLVVVLAAFPGGSLGPRYTWYSVLGDRDWHRLFILDDLGPLGSYYFGAGRRAFVADAVAAVISRVAEGLRVPPENIIACGSSKGGWSALHLAFRHAYGHVVAGGPQVRLGTFLLEEAPAAAHVADLIAGGRSSEDRAWLDGLLLDVVDRGPGTPDVHLHGGELDVERHIRFLVPHLDRRGVRHTLDRADYGEHQGLVQGFKPFMVDRVEAIVRGRDG